MQPFIILRNIRFVIERSGGEEYEQCADVYAFTNKLYMSVAGLGCVLIGMILGGLTRPC